MCNVLGGAFLFANANIPKTNKMSWTYLRLLMVSDCSVMSQFRAATSRRSPPSTTASEWIGTSAIPGEGPGAARSELLKDGENSLSHFDKLSGSDIFPLTIGDSPNPKDISAASILKLTVMSGSENTNIFVSYNLSQSSD